MDKEPQHALPEEHEIEKSGYQRMNFMDTAAPKPKYKDGAKVSMMFWKGDIKTPGDFKIVSSGINPNTNKWEYSLVDAKTGETHDSGKRVEEGELGRTR